MADRNKNMWRAEEDMMLKAQIRAGKSYPKIAEMIPGRSDGACRKRAIILGVHVTRVYEGVLMCEERDSAHDYWWDVLRHKIPKEDTRDYTARMFGDPIPERSALYARNKAS